eukprot:15356751-Ditylum_brightwellii.AAC.1
MVEEAYALINEYSDKANQRATGATSNGAMSFNTVGQEAEKKEDENQDEEIVLPTGGAKVRPDITCHNCNKKGHFSSNCPDKANTSNISFLNFGHENGNFVFLCQEIAPDDE